MERGDDDRACLYVCTTLWGVWGRGGDAYVMCGLTIVWRGSEGEHGPACMCQPRFVLNVFCMDKHPEFSAAIVNGC